MRHRSWTNALLGITASCAALLWLVSLAPLTVTAQDDPVSSESTSNSPTEEPASQLPDTPAAGSGEAVSEGSNGSLPSAPADPQDPMEAESSGNPNDVNLPQDNATEENPGEAVNETAAVTPTETKKDDWYAKTDQIFKKYVLDPLTFVLFNSFGTEYILGRKIPFVVAWLFVAAAFLTVRMGFVNIRCFWHAIRLTKGDYDSKDDKGEVSHFQALSSALSATVGLGNIAGVALAVGAGGPGAIFWMILIGLLGMTSKFTECTLGQLYRKVHPDGTVSGGAMHYLKDGLKELYPKAGIIKTGLTGLGAVLAVVFSFLCILASFGGGNSYQVGQSLDAIRQDIPMLQEGQYPVVYGLIMAVMTGLVIIGGIKSIGRVASIIVPFMCVGYVGMALYILFTNYADVPAAINTILTNAWSFEAGLGGLLGVMVLGIKRAVFSNEAGTGSAAIAHSAAKTNEPVSEGIVALLEPFIDTVVVCTMTGLVIVIAGGAWTPNKELASMKIGQERMVEIVSDTGATALSPMPITAEMIDAQPLGSWENAEYGKAVVGGAGASLTLSAVTGEKGLPAFKWILYAAVVMFAYSTIISWSYYGERCWSNLFGEGSSMVYKILFLIFTVLGSIVTKGNILDFSDALILGMSFPNLLGIYLMSGRVKRELNTYLAKLKSGEIHPQD